MKILQINSTLNWGSTGRIAEEIGNAIKVNLGESYIAYGRYHNISSSKVIHIGNKWSLFMHILETRLFDKHGLASKKATSNLLVEIDNISPDIIHLHNIHGYYINYQFLFDYLEKVNIPVVWTLHDCWSFTGHCAYYTYLNCSKWQSGCGNCPNMKSYPKSYFVDRSADNYKLKKESFLAVPNITIVPVSDWLANEVKKSFLNKFPIQVIHNGIDISKFVNTTNISTEKKFFTILGVASVWESRKGLVDFLRLSKILKSDEQIVLVGLSDKQIQKLPANIKGVQRTNNVEELTQLYSNADVFVNPTWEDNFPTTNIEALACGTPVITYNTGGSPEAIDSSCGFVVNPGDISQLYESIQIIKKKSKMFFASHCRKRAMLFDKDKCYTQYIQLYKKLLRS